MKKLFRLDEILPAAAACCGVTRVILLFMVFGMVSGCESRQHAREQAREAFVAGQSQALAQQQSLLQAQHPSVTVRGEVQSPVVSWTDGMTLSKAIVTAHYTGFMNPSVVRVIRNGQVIQQFLGVDLLRGHDMPLEAGDVVELTP